MAMTDEEIKRHVEEVRKELADGQILIDRGWKPIKYKQQGVYYTPKYIVDYIVEQTLGRLLEERGSDKKFLTKLTVLDPACGSGSFLIAAYQRLLEHYAKMGKKAPEQLSQDERINILLQHIYGVDIDEQAVEITRLNLLLMVLKEPQLLPELNDNIVCGNSLISGDAETLERYFEENWRDKQPLNWEERFSEVMGRGGFDVVIGNPPYVRVQTLADEDKRFFADAYETPKGSYDIYVVFVEKGLSVLNEQGRLGFILPNKFMNAKYGEPLRDLIASGRYLNELIHFGDEQVFEQATTYTALLFLDKAGVDAAHVVKVSDLNAWQDWASGLSPLSETAGSVAAEHITAAEWNFVVGRGAKVFEKLNTIPKTLGDIASVFVGLQTSADKVYILEEIAPPKEGFVKLRDQKGQEWNLERGALKPFLNNITVATYQDPRSNHWLIFPYLVGEGTVTLVSDNEMLRAYPRTWEYLNEYAETLKMRESGKADNDQWYGYIYRKNMLLFDSPKLIVQVISQYGRYTFDDSGLYFTGGGNGPYYGVRWLDPANPHSIHFLQALLSSRLLDFYLHLVSSPFRGGYWSYGKRFIEQLPIRTIDFDKADEVKLYDRMVGHVENLMALHERRAGVNEQVAVEREIEYEDEALNGLVYELYGLTDEEIAIVKG